MSTTNRFGLYRSIGIGSVVAAAATLEEAVTLAQKRLATQANGPSYIIREDVAVVSREVYLPPVKVTYLKEGR